MGSSRRLLPLTLSVVAAGLVIGACAIAVAADGPVVGGPPVVRAPALSPLPPITVGSVIRAPAAPVTAIPAPPLTISFGGDTSFTHGLHRHDPLSAVSDLLAAPDLMLVNLETTVAEGGVGTASNKTYVFKSPPETIDLLIDAGIDGVSLANNHTLDFGRSALLRTIELVDEGGLLRAGAGTDAAAAYAPTFVDVAGRRIGLVSFSRISCGGLSSEVASVCDPERATALASVGAADAGADLVVVMVHWGIERDRCPHPIQRELAEQWAAAGADLIVGSHPHVLQGVERIGSSWLVHSTGNLAFPSAREASSYTALFEFTLTSDDASLRVIPLRAGSGRPHLADEHETERILNDLTASSIGYAFDAEGNAVPTTARGACG